VFGVLGVFGVVGVFGCGICTVVARLRRCNIKAQAYSC